MTGSPVSPGPGDSAGPPGRPLGSGRSAEIFDLGEGRILRRYHDRTRSAEREAKIISWAREHGVPVPEVFDVAGPGIVMEKVDGPTMLADLARRPWRLFRHAAALATMHRQVHAVPGLPGLGTPFGDGDALLHMDLHPLNVLLSPCGPVLIDWESASRGPAEADLAICWVTVALSSVPGSAWQRAVGRAGQRLFADAVLRHSGLRVDGEWLAKAARFRIDDPHVLEAEAARMRRLLDRAGASSEAGAAPAADPGPEAGAGQ
jgi:aminoglycoside phosphotransferase (APT) family kinase protein